jgi:hypothetical protein
MPSHFSAIPSLEVLNLDVAHPGMSREVQLPNGALSIKTLPSRGHIDELCEFAARVNRRRGFLFVSRVLGRHLPVRPAVMRQSWRALAELLAPDLPRPIVFFGLAETAIALGHGVYREFFELEGGEEMFYLHSTRYRFARPLLGEFSEEHSHATRHFVYAPTDLEVRASLQRARTLVLVDDEMTTGRTFRNVLGALEPAFPQLERVVGLVLTDWSGDRREDSGLETDSLLRGRFSFEAATDMPPPQMPNVASSDALRDAALPRNDGRFTLRSPLVLSDAIKSRLLVRPGERVAVVGTGEFVTAPFLVAEHLEGLGAAVRCHATTRSPAVVSNAMRCRETFTDHYGDGIPNFIYNLAPEDYDRILVCHETPRPQEPIERLGNIPVTSIHL